MTALSRWQQIGNLGQQLARMCGLTPSELNAMSLEEFDRIDALMTAYLKPHWYDGPDAYRWHPGGTA